MKLPVSLSMFLFSPLFSPLCVFYCRLNSDLFVCLFFCLFVSFFFPFLVHLPIRDFQISFFTFMLQFYPPHMFFTLFFSVNQVLLCIVLFFSLSHSFFEKTDAASGDDGSQTDNLPSIIFASLKDALSLSVLPLSLLQMQTSKSFALAPYL